MKDGTSHSFVLVLDHYPTSTDEWNRIGQACDDAAVSITGTLATAEFDRDSDSIAAAVASAIRDIESCGFIVQRVLHQDLVNIADIATRIGQTPESVRRYTTGERGGGSFPPPINEGATVAFYRWSEVRIWLQTALEVTTPEVDASVALADLVVQMRLMLPLVRTPADLLDLITVPAGAPS